MKNLYHTKQWMLAIFELPTLTFSVNIMKLNVSYHRPNEIKYSPSSASLAWYKAAIFISFKATIDGIRDSEHVPIVSSVLWWLFWSSNDVENINFTNTMTYSL